MGEIIRSGQDSMLEHCYVSNRQLDEFSQDLQQLLTYDASFDEQDFPVESISEGRLEQTLDIQLDAANPRTILLVGNVGAGKTTFVHRFIRQEVRPKRHVCVVVDLINQVQINVELGRLEEQKLASMVIERLASEFREKLDPFDPVVLRGCFETEVGRFKKQRKSLQEKNLDQFLIEEEKYIFELTADKYKHLVGYLKYSRKKRFKPWIAFDNVDRGSDNYQEFVYAFAHQLSADAGCVTLITLREDTFLEAQEAGFLDVRNSDIIFRVSAPEFRQVVSKRRKYVDWLIRNDQLPKSFKAYVKLIEILNWHINRLVLDEDDFVRFIISTFSLNNIRYGLGLLRRYYCSYHCTFHEFYQYLVLKDSKNEDKLDYEKEQSRFIQSLMLSNSWSYREETSEVFNIFSVDPLEQTSHFLMLRVLAYINLERNSQSSRISITYDKIRNDFVFLGYQRHHVNNAVRRLLYAGLVVSPNLPANPATEAKVEIPDPINKEMKIALSAKGLCYLKKIVSLPYYQTRVGEDTVWYNDNLTKEYIKCLRESNNIQKVPHADDLLQATEAKEIFVQYLRKSLLEETQAGNVRFPLKDWARIMNDTVERCIFGGSVTQSVYMAESDSISSSSSYITVPPAISTTVLRNIKITNDDTQPKQARFAEIIDEIDYNQAIKQAVRSLGPMPKTQKVQGSTYLVRVLWTLEIASRAGIGALIPSRIAELIYHYGEMPVEATNVARFFREQKRSGDFTYLWRENPEGHYMISSVGRDKLYSLL